MNTTSLYVELIIIGAQVIAWLLLFLDRTSLSVIWKLANETENGFLLIVCLISAYILGLLFDRIADLVYHKLEKNIKHKSGMEAKSSILIEETEKMREHQFYTRSKYRILRATSINIPLITLAGLVNLQCAGELNVVYGLIAYFVCLILTAISVWSSIDTLTKFFDLAKLIELYNIKSNRN